MELEQLRQLVMIADCGTLSAASERLCLSQSALSRSIRRLEEDLDCILFDRTKNRMIFNAAGETILMHARIVLADAARLEEAAAEHRRRERTLHIASCAPAPLWRLVPLITQKYPEMVIIPQLQDLETIERNLMTGAVDIGVLPYRPSYPDVLLLPFMDEKLYAALPLDHALAHHDAISLKDLDGDTFLLYHNVGFWWQVLKEHMPRAHYILQKDYLVFSQLAPTSPLPGFVTDASETERFMGNRKIIPITDEEAVAHYHLAAPDVPRWTELFDWISERIKI